MVIENSHNQVEIMIMHACIPNMLLFVMLVYVAIILVW